jgi:GTPase
MLKTVAIVGRPNVGKSALFNRLAGMNISIVHDMPGVTRDRIVAECRRGPQVFEIMDTGGIGASTEDVLTDQVQVEASIALDIADLLLFVVDVMDGITTIDNALAGELRKTNKPVILVCNKADSPQRKTRTPEFTRLGFPDQVEVSAAHGLGITELVDLISERLELSNEPSTAEASPSTAAKPLKIAIVGRPNAGKSSLVNQVLGKTRSIVSDLPGTTRDSLDIRCAVNGHDYILIDTAGIRKQAKIDEPVEIFSINQAIKSIKRADICLLMIDCAEGAKMQDRKIAQIILEEQKPCILVMNKYDLFHPRSPKGERIEELTETISREFFFLSYAPIVAISAKKAQQIDKLFQAVERVRRGANTRISTGALNRILARAIANSPTSMGNSPIAFKLLYATQVNRSENVAIPVPHFVLFANRATKMQDSYLRHLEKVIREEWPAEGIPFRMSVRGKEAKALHRQGGSGTAAGGRSSTRETKKKTKPDRGED